MTRPRLLLFVPTYNAGRRIEWVLDRIPVSLTDDWDVEVLVIDDGSTDDTCAIARRHLTARDLPFPVTVLANSRNQGYGGNQKLGYTYAVDHGFDVVVMIHGDGQYPPEQAHELAAAALEHGAAFGSRFLRQGGALSGGMPPYKFVGNRILTRLQNALLGTSLSEFHSGFRAYRTDQLARVPFDVNSSDFHFDTEIIIQMLRAGVEIAEIDIPTHYGDEVSHVNGLRYAKDVVVETLKSRIHDLGLLYERKFDIDSSTPYESKTEFDSPTQRAVELVPPGSTVLDLGSGDGHMSRQLRARGCTVIGVDAWEPASREAFDQFYLHDLEKGLPDVGRQVDVVVMLDVIEHLRSPEEFVWHLRTFCHEHGVRRLLVSTGNIAFLVTRFALLFGQFNYGRRGILDMTHTRLFTFGTITTLFEQAGFEVASVEGVPAPFQLALGGGRVADLLTSLNEAVIRVLRRLGSYQIMLDMRPPAQLRELLREGQSHADRMAEVDAG